MYVLIIIDLILFLFVFMFGTARIIGVTIAQKEKKEFRKLESKVLNDLGFSSLDIISEVDANVVVKSRQALDKYDDVKFFKENKGKLLEAESKFKRKQEQESFLRDFLSHNEYKNHPMYELIEKKIKNNFKHSNTYGIEVKYISSANNVLGTRIIKVSKSRITEMQSDASILMSKGEYNNLVKEQQKKALENKHHEYYEKVNAIIDYANENKDKLIIKNSKDVLDNLVFKLFDRTINSIQKIKTVDSKEWEVVGNYISNIEQEIRKVVGGNNKILNYYVSPSFQKIKETCDNLMSTQREFNEYINEKAQSISKLFGTRVVRNETEIDDKYNYIRPYKKTITPFTAEVSATVFASAENNPLDYIVKYFYPNKEMYPEQIQKLQTLVEELETLQEAKQIIENYKKEYEQYILDVPSYIMENDEAGFYARLGFANIDESVLAIEYKFSYTSNGGMSQRSFTVPMTEETIVELIKMLESKLTMSAFAKEQRTLMTKKMRQCIKERDNFTCCNCGNSTHVEPNLLLEIDHIIPVAKGGLTVEENLQTLCWVCNRAKSDKLV